MGTQILSRNLTVILLPPPLCGGNGMEAHLLAQQLWGRSMTRASKTEVHGMAHPTGRACWSRPSAASTSLDTADAEYCSTVRSTGRVSPCRFHVFSWLST